MATWTGEGKRRYEIENGKENEKRSGLEKLSLKRRKRKQRNEGEMERAIPSMTAIRFPTISSSVMSEPSSYLAVYGKHRNGRKGYKGNGVKEKSPEIQTEIKSEKSRAHPA